ncbi:hypothetical protein [Methyloglobulus sp.]|uniref:hypothetical protein n=1 Tax=Methyloglobulus sp. TaxID=2518622 RepID=UPI0039896247
MTNTPKRSNKSGWQNNGRGFCPLSTKRMNTLPIMALLLLFLGGTASAGDAARQYHIPAQSLNNALLQFAADTNLELIVKADELRGFKASGLDGNLSPSQALTRLL